MAASPSATPTPTAEPDRVALVALYNATDGPNWRHTRFWLSEQPIRHWIGVTADRNGSVTELDLNGGNLRGPLPPELGTLSKLTRLNLSFNRLTGPIRPELGALSELTSLNLSFNRLTGPIPPELGALSGLTRLSLEYNRLSSELPAELGKLSALVYLRLTSSGLQGKIPPELGNLSNLTVLELDLNQLTGQIPPELGNLSLERVKLSNNLLSGCVPEGLGARRFSSFGTLPYCGAPEWQTVPCALRGAVLDADENPDLVVQHH